MAMAIFASFLAVSALLVSGTGCSSEGDESPTCTQDAGARAAQVLLQHGSSSSSATPAHLDHHKDQDGFGPEDAELKRKRSHKKAAPSAAGINKTGAALATKKVAPKTAEAKEDEKMTAPAIFADALAAVKEPPALSGRDQDKAKAKAVAEVEKDLASVSTSGASSTRAGAVPEPGPVQGVATEAVALAAATSKDNMLTLALNIAVIGVVAILILFFLWGGTWKQLQADPEAELRRTAHEALTQADHTLAPQGYENKAGGYLNPPGGKAAGKGQPGFGFGPPSGAQSSGRRQQARAAGCC